MSGVLGSSGSGAASLAVACEVEVGAVLVLASVGATVRAYRLVVQGLSSQDHVVGCAAVDSVAVGDSGGDGDRVCEVCGVSGSDPVLDVEGCRLRVDLVAMSEAAEILGVSRQRATRLADRAGFPAPVALIRGVGRVWRRGDVELFAALRNRKPGRPKAGS